MLAHLDEVQRAGLLSQLSDAEKVLRSVSGARLLFELKQALLALLAWLASPPAL
jgi:hypothetical protein